MIFYSFSHELPTLLDKGYVVKKLPQPIIDQLNTLYEKSKKFTREETKDEALSINGKSELNILARYGYDRDRLIDSILPLHEEVFKVNLTPSVMYGVRKYHKGSTLDMHTDKFTTHHVGSIIVVDKDLDGQEDWPLHIVNNQGVEDKVYLNVGDIIFYESARLLHGRPNQLMGNYYSIIMTHLSIDGYKHKPIHNLL
jgi:prolyl 4-hydroxylase